MFTTLEIRTSKQPLRRSARVNPSGLVSASDVRHFLPSGRCWRLPTEWRWPRLTPRARARRSEVSPLKRPEHACWFNAGLESLPGGMQRLQCATSMAAGDPGAQGRRNLPAESAGGHFDPDESGKHWARMGKGIW